MKNIPYRYGLVIVLSITSNAFCWNVGNRYRDHRSHSFHPRLTICQPPRAPIRLRVDHEDLVTTYDQQQPARAYSRRACWIHNEPGIGAPATGGRICEPFLAWRTTCRRLGAHAATRTEGNCHWSRYVSIRHAYFSR